MGMVLAHEGKHRKSAGVDAHTTAGLESGAAILSLQNHAVTVLGKLNEHGSGGVVGDDSHILCGGRSFPRRFKIEH